MSDTVSEFLENWNATMSVHIRDSDVTKPTEATFRRSLLLLLKEFYVDTSEYENMDNESGNRLRESRIRFVAIVNHFYKISNPGAKQCFCFMDLIQPSKFDCIQWPSLRFIFISILGFKKTFNVLKYLLNFCAFVRHTYSETIGALKGQMQERDELRAVKNQLRKEIEDAKIREENNARSIKDLDAQIPRQKAKIVEQEEKLKSLRNEAARIHEECEKTDMKMLEQKSEIAEISNVLVSDQEIQSILTAKEDVERQLEEQDQITAAGRQKLQENSNAIDEASAITAKMETLQFSYKFDAGELKNQNKQVEDLQVEINSLRSDIKKMRVEYESTVQNEKLKRANIARLLKNREEIAHNYKLKEADQRKEFIENDNLVHKLRTQEAALTIKNQQLKYEQALFFKLSRNTMNFLSEKNFEDPREQS